FQSIDNSKLLGARSDVVAVFQHVNLFPNKTVLENIIDAYIVIQKQSKQVATLKSRSLLKQVGLLSQTHLYPQKLSIGQKRRIALAQVLACRPRIILFDNPTAELEEEDSTIIVNLIKQLHAEGIT